MVSETTEAAGHATEAVGQATESAGHAAEAVGHATEAAGHAAEAWDPGASIVGHLLDHSSFHVMDGVDFPLPHIEPFFNGLLDLSITKHVAMMWMAGLLILLLGWLAARRRHDAVPTGLRNAFEVLISFIRDEVVRKSIGEGADRYVGYLLTTFFFVLACNLLGLVPGMATATGNISVTAGLALMAFAMIQFAGIRNYGVIKHFKNLVPPGLPMWLVPLMFALELLSMFVKPFALCVRLFANMMAGHVVILAFISLIFILGDVFSEPAAWAASPVAVGFALFVHFLELLVSFVQAYIFTMLTATFIGMSAHPAH
jgi:F-type H+-transporting ATPase subunit a